MTATAAQLSTSTLNSLNDSIIIEGSKIPTIEFVEVVEEADEAFDFNIEDYLPLGFDTNMTFEEKYEIVYEINLEEADEAFDFNTADYLPVGYNLNENILNSIVEITVDEEDESFDFDTKKYLPIGFEL
jgi:hypothetical protein